MNKQKQIYFIFFDNSMCPHCKNFNDTWEKLCINTKLMNIVTFVRFEYRKHGHKYSGHLPNRYNRIVVYFPFFLLHVENRESEGLVFDSKIRTVPEINYWITDIGLPKMLLLIHPKMMWYILFVLRSKGVVKDLRFYLVTTFLWSYMINRCKMTEKI